jgi:hypothetical protein
MVDTGQVYQSNSEYLKAREFKDCDPVEATITGASVDDYEGDLAVMVELDFGSDVQKKWRLNKTNADRIEMVAGSSETDDWVGQVITLYWDETVEYPKGTYVGGLRVQIPMKATGKKAAFLKSQKAQAPSENPAEGMDDEVPF